MSVTNTEQPNTKLDSTAAEPLREKIIALRSLLNSQLKGKKDVVEQVLICLLAQGHLLLEDQPGLGKTTLAKALATGLGEEFARVQCTPDLLPSDVTGFNIFNQKSHEFEFRPGPVFAEVLLADEINRATPRTQSALLEAMAERQVTIDSQRYPLPKTFFVIATQNPIEQHGTYPLPEAQLDRFAMKLSIGYPAAADEREMLQASIGPARSQSNTLSVLQPGELIVLQQQVSAISVATPLLDYLVTLGEKSRTHPRIHLGISPRGLLTWLRCAQARAYLLDRPFVTPEDIQTVSGPVLSVRLGLDDAQPERLITELIESVPVPLA